jgi:hypothetical protein
MHKHSLFLAGSRWSRVALYGLVLTAFVGCDDCIGPLPEFDPPTADCDLPEPVFVPPDPCGGREAFPPLVLTDRPGPPVESAATFAFETPARLCLSIRLSRVAAAQVLIDDALVVTPSSFTPHVRTVRKLVDLEPGEHNLRVQLTGGALGPERKEPDSRTPAELTVSATWAPTEPDHARIMAASDLLALEKALCDEFNLSADAVEDPDQLAPFIAGSRRTGMPMGRIQVLTSVYGTPRWLSPLPTEDLGVTDDAEAAARTWLTRHAGLMGISPTTELTVGHRIEDTRGNVAVVFDQHISHIPVFGGIAVVYVNSAFQVTHVQANIVPDQGVARIPTLEPSEAESIALQDISPAPATDTALMVLDRSLFSFLPETILAWRVRIDGIGSIFVDAHNGTILHTDSRIFDFDAHMVRYDPRLDVSGFGGTLVHALAAGLVLAAAPSDVVFTTRPGESIDAPCVDFPDCQDLFAKIGQVNSFYVRAWGRDGFSDGKAARNGEHHVRFNTSGGAFIAPCYPGVDSCESTLITPNFAVISHEVQTLNALAHEYGHGYLADPDVQARTWQQGHDQGFLGEHAGDLIASLTDLALDRPGDPFSIDGVNSSVRNHSRLECPSYGSVDCDSSFLFMTMSSNLIPLGCREYVHMDFMANLDGPGPIHQNSCIYSRLAYLLLQADAPSGIRRRGIDLAGNFSREFGVAFFKRLFSSDVLSIGIDDYWQYPVAYHSAAGDFVARCASAGPDSPFFSVPECAAMASLDEGDRTVAAMALHAELVDALMSQGFWSPEYVLPSARSVTPPTAVVAEAAGEDGKGVYLFHTDPVTHAIMMTVITDVFSSEIGSQEPAVDLGQQRVGGAALKTGEKVAVHAEPDGSLLLAYVDEDTSRVRVIERTAGGAWSEIESPQDAVAERGVAIGIVRVSGERRPIVVFAPPGDAFRVFFVGATNLEEMVISGRDVGSLVEGPSLAVVDHGAEETVILGYVSSGLSTSGRRRAHVELRAWEPEAGTFAQPMQGCAVSSPMRGAPGSRYTLECHQSGLCASSEDCCAGQTCFLGICLRRACTDDADCGTDGAGSRQGATCGEEDRSVCVAGRCSVFRREPVRAWPGGTGLEIVPMVTADGGSVLRVVTSTNLDSAGTVVGVHLTSLPVVLNDGLFVIDDFDSSRQVRLDPSYRAGFAAVSVSGLLPGESSLVVFGLHEDGRVGRIYRRSE